MLTQGAPTPTTSLAPARPSPRSVLPSALKWKWGGGRGVQSAERSWREAVTCSRGCTYHRIDLDPRASTTTSRGSQAMRPDTFRSRRPRAREARTVPAQMGEGCCSAALVLQSLSSALLRRRARSMRCAPCLVAGVNRFSRCSAARVQSLSSASALLRRRARSMRCAPCLYAGVNRFSRCSAARVQSLSRRRLCSVALLDRCGARACCAMLASPTVSRVAALSVSGWLSAQQLCARVSPRRRQKRATCNSQLPAQRIRAKKSGSSPSEPMILRPRGSIFGVGFRRARFDEFLLCSHNLRR